MPDASVAQCITAQEPRTRTINRPLHPEEPSGQPRALAIPAHHESQHDTAQEGVELSKGIEDDYELRTVARGAHITHGDRADHEESDERRAKTRGYERDQQG